MPSYYDWMHELQSCPTCNWTGKGSEAIFGEAFDSGAEYHCPKCDYYFGYIAYPLIEEALNDPRASEGDRVIAKLGRPHDSPVSVEDVDCLADTKAKVRSVAISHQIKLGGFFLTSLIITFFVWWLGNWAESKHGWESEAVSLIFKGISAIGLFLSLSFGIMLWGWFSMFKGALNSADWYARDPESFRRLYSDVVGPIPWK